MNLVYAYNYISVDIQADFNIFNDENARDSQVLNPSFEGESGILNKTGPDKTLEK